jgi:hypothetical protein
MKPTLVLDQLISELAAAQADEMALSKEARKLEACRNAAESRRVEADERLRSAIRELVEQRRPDA